MAIQTITVSTAAQLAAALKASTGGETILLDPGNYGDVKLNSFKPASQVVVKSATSTDAVLQSLSVQFSQNFTFSDLEIARPIAAGASQESNAVYVQGSTHIDLVNSFIHGSLNNNSWDDAKGIRITDSRDIQLDNNVITEFKLGLSLEKSDALAISNNTVYELREGINLFDVDHALVDHNLIHTIKPNTALGDHADAIQVFTGSTYAASTDLTISNNAILQGAGGYAQGIYIQSERQASGIKHSNIQIENNLYSGVSQHGITLNGVNGAVVTKNTVVAAPGSPYDTAININNSSYVAVMDNVATSIQTTKAVNTFLVNNVDLHIGGSPDGWEIGAVLANALNAGTTDIHDFAVLAGSVAEAQGAGFSVSAFDTRQDFAYYDGVAQSLYSGGFLHHIV